MKDELGERIKSYEKESLALTHVEGFRHYIVRLDGNNFSKFTKGLAKPHDVNFSQVMILTAKDLVEKYHAVTGYTHSDEVTLIFRQMCTHEEYQEEKKEHLHNGKTSKIISLMASYCSVRFNYHYNKLINNEVDNKYDDITIQKLRNMTAVFDARIIVFPLEKQDIEIANHMIWRSVFDCYRNAVSTYHDYYVGKKKSFGLHTTDKVMSLMVHGHDFAKVPMYYQHGSYIKKILVKKEIEYVHKKTGEKHTTTATRSEYVNFTMLANSKKECIQLLLSKTLENFDGEFVVMQECLVEV